MATTFLSDNTTDPYLQYRPKFAYSLPVQILLQGTTFTLLTVLLIHLLFTTQYHYPLSRSNYALQTGGIVILLTAVVATLCIILTSNDVEGKDWPYMLQYVQVSVPPDEWNMTGKVFWYLLLACCNFLIHLGHIQFLTLLYPSGLEVKLIYILLGPLSICASGLTFTALSTNRTVIDLGDAIRNVFNSTLLLIFCISLILWGAIVNRKRAWRLDGGTCLFGIASTSLAVGSTMMNFVAVREDGLDWFQNLIWATVAWQSFSGYWWWVGSGMGIGEVEDILERDERKRVKAEAKKARRKRSDAARARMLAAEVEKRERDAAGGVGSHARSNNTAGDARSSQRSAAGGGGGSTTALGQFVDGWRRNGSGMQGLTRRSGNTAIVAVMEEIELRDVGQSSSGSRLRAERRASHESSSAVQGDRSSRPAQPARTNSANVQPSASNATPGAPQNTSSSSTVSGTPLESVSGILGYPINGVLRFIRFLRRNHEKAATEKVIERVTKRNKVFAAGGGSANDAAASGATPRTAENSTEKGRRSTTGISRTSLKVIARDGTSTTGWGLGRRGVIEAEEGARRLEEAQRIARGERLLATDEEDEGDKLSDPEAEPDVDVSDAERGEAATPGAFSRVPVRRARFTEGQEAEDAALQAMEGELEEEWVDEEPTDDRRTRPVRHNGVTRRAKGKARAGLPRAPDPVPPPPLEAGQQGWTWWGPLRKWRLADRSTF